MDFVEKYLIENIRLRRPLLLVGVIGNFEVSVSIIIFLLKLRTVYSIILLAMGIIIAIGMLEKVNVTSRFELLSLLAVNTAILLAMRMAL